MHTWSQGRRADPHTAMKLAFAWFQRQKYRREQKIALTTDCEFAWDKILLLQWLSPMPPTTATFATEW